MLKYFAVLMTIGCTTKRYTEQSVKVKELILFQRHILYMVILFYR